MDKIVAKALQLSNNGRHSEASHLFQRAGNQYRPVQEKQLLWDAAKRSKMIALSD